MGDLNGVIQAIMELFVAAIVGVIFYSFKKNELDESESGKSLEKMFFLLLGMLVLEGVAYLIRRFDGGFVSFFVRGAQFLLYEADLAMCILYFLFLKKSLPKTGVDEKKIKIVGYIVYGVSYVGAILVILNLFTRMMYSFDASNRIQKNTFFDVFLLILAIPLVVDFIILKKHRMSFSKKKFWVLASYCFLPFIAVVLSYFSYGIAFYTFSIAAALVINFEYLMSDGPDEEPEMSDDMIPFEIERAHVEAYVELEQERLGDKIKVNWDVKVTDFTIPPLSIQKMVENAIRYGVGTKHEGGIVLIKVEEKIGEVLISVADDGRGFDLSKLNEKNEHLNSAHSAILEVEENLKVACNGTIDVTSTKDVGTLVKIHIPR